jgi:hypothetical protein
LERDKTLLDLWKIERQIGRSPWRDCCRSCAMTGAGSRAAIGDKSGRGGLTSLGTMQ